MKLLKFMKFPMEPGRALARHPRGPYANLGIKFLTDSLRFASVNWFDAERPFSVFSSLWLRRGGVSQRPALLWLRSQPHPSLFILGNLSDVTHPGHRNIPLISHYSHLNISQILPLPAAQWVTCGSCKLFNY